MKYLLAVVLLVMASSATHAQIKDCGNGIPCGVIPWTMPELPQLNSPTPAPTIAATATPSAPAPTSTSVFTPTPQLDGIGDGLGAVDAMLSATPMTINDINGTPVAIDYETMAGDSSLFISYAKAILLADFGVLSPLLQFLFFLMIFMITVKLAEVSIPLIAIVFGGLRKIVQVILDFLPF